MKTTDHVCQLCGAFAEFRSDEGVYRHANDQFKDASLFCDRQGYPIPVLPAPTFRMVKVRPADDAAGWLILRESEAFEAMRENSDESRWTVEFAGEMTLAEIEALPEFDGF